MKIAAGIYRQRLVRVQSEGCAGGITGMDIHAQAALVSLNIYPLNVMFRCYGVCG